MKISKQTRQALKENQKNLRKKPNVIGVAVGEKISDGEPTGEEAVIVFVREKVPVEGDAMIPQEVNGNTKTDVVVLGNIRAQSYDEDFLKDNPPSNFVGLGNLKVQQGRTRPIIGGISIGHYLVTAGTLGIMVKDVRTMRAMILSNNHILANSNEAEIGSVIIQPGRVDGGDVNEDIVASLARFERIRWVGEASCDIAGGLVRIVNGLARALGRSHRIEAYDSNIPENKVDAAVALPDVEYSFEIMSIGPCYGVIPAKVGDFVRKFGRTTGYTEGQIQYLGASIDVSYGDKVARFVDQIITTPMSEGGDSGSLVVAGDSDNAVGLLFAGSSQATIINPIGAVLDALEVEIG